MAQIRTSKRAGGSAGPTVVVVVGAFTAADMRRLEHVCGPALTVRDLDLQIDLSGVTSCDATAAAVLQRLADRGARVLPPRGVRGTRDRGDGRRPRRSPEP